MDFANQYILLGSLLLVASIVASLVSSRLGAPVLLIFLLLGMLAGGPGGLHFDDVRATYLIGNVALAVILFDGGLRTHINTFRVGLKPALSLATLGVLVTTGITGVFAARILHLSWLSAGLLGAIVASTDAAVVFSLLHQRQLELKQRVAATLEIESGCNDPMAVFLTITLVHLIRQPEAHGFAFLALDFLREMGIGALLGWLGGRALALLINRLTLYSSLYPILAAAFAVLVFAVANLAGGSGFLAIYLTGLITGNRRIHAEQNIRRVNDGFAWLAQIVMFLLLGILVTPAALLSVAWPALLIALALMLVARPASVFLSLLPFRFPLTEQLFIAWVGLRGAVPIVLALFPLLAGLPRAGLYFNVAFFVVLISLILQGWTVEWAASRLGLEVPPQPQPVQQLDLDAPGPINYELLGYPLTEGSLAAYQPVAYLALPRHTQIAAVLRKGEATNLRRLRHLEPGDFVYLLATAESTAALNRLFAVPHVPARLEEHAFFGDFVLNGEARLGEIGQLYGFQVTPAAAGLSVAEYIAQAFHHRPVVGDRVRLGQVELVVRETGERGVARVGLKFLGLA